MPVIKFDLMTQNTFKSEKIWKFEKSTFDPSVSSQPMYNYLQDLWGSDPRPMNIPKTASAGSIRMVEQAEKSDRTLLDFESAVTSQP